MCVAHPTLLIMSNYIRRKTNGGTYFFTVVANQRRAILCDDSVRVALRQSIITVRQRFPFDILAWVLMPDHMHCIWRLPENDNDFGKRWSMIKRLTSKSCPQYHLPPEAMSLSKLQRHDFGIWQRRFYEHEIRHEQEFQQILDYIHYNPVKHGLVKNAKDWEFSTFHRYVRQGFYSLDWASDGVLMNDFME